MPCSDNWCSKASNSLSGMFSQSDLSYMVNRKTVFSINTACVIARASPDLPFPFQAMAIRILNLYNKNYLIAYLV